MTVTSTGAIAPPDSPDTRLPERTVALVGLMGAGKTAIGKRLAARFGLPFRDADAEIEAAAGCTVAEIFSRFGEAEFRVGERRVIARLMELPAHILATGGGAFIDLETRGLLRGQAITVWLRADLDLLVARTARKTHRPLLRQGEPREILGRLIEARYPIYQEADLVVDSSDVPAEDTVEAVVQALERYLGHPLPSGAHQPARTEPKPEKMP